MQNDVILTIDDLSKQIGDKTILRNICVGIHATDKIGIVGINGSGKSTLLKIISNQISASTGNITTRKDLKIAHLEQDAEIDPRESVLNHVFGGLDVNPEEDYVYKAVLTQLGITEFDKALGLLSGGQRRKTDLAKALVQNADLLILDEPTNHLDMDTIEWLQEYLAKLNKCVIFVTHDRYFLDAVCDQIWELEHCQLHCYQGNYSEFVRGKLLRETGIKRKETRRQAQLKKELDWLARGAKARTSKPKNHVDRVRELISKSYLISNAELNISFMTARLGKTILELHKLSKSYGAASLFRDVDHIFQAQERIGIIGPNGCGKTTLLKLITGEEIPDTGSIKVGLNTDFSYYKQDDDTFDPKLSVYDYIAQFAEVVRTADGNKVSATEMLKRFLFDGKMQQQKLGALSGGERKRLYLLKSLMFGSNFIIMDEPTNDLDIRTLEILEDYLDAFKGCIIMVSHDRFFLDRTVDYLFIFEDGEIRKFPGNYSDYLLVKKFQTEEAEERQNPIVLKPKRSRKGLSFNEQRELNQITKLIDEIENRIIDLENMLGSEHNSLSHMDYATISTELETLNQDHQKLLSRWMELSDKDET
ncbi:MAG: ABC-F family ATP-binding cassette domain-containing protein [Candidatus Cloacimonadaceae bacterium]|nr:ABC-F family ATP-binding cassette domain-containing protein [Candidatus Cloacimonadaceae bacterium]MDP3113180.1 ABC-F family ATP-binding cassette domain-containing protein [Candidatus Cloacimonadaceae bacterium]